MRVTFSQSGGIFSTVARDLWQHKLSLFSGYALGLGSVYCHKSLAPCCNYNIILIFHTGIKNGILIFISALAVILILVSAVKLFSELTQFLYGLSKPCRGSSEKQKYWWLYFSYFSDLSNWLELPLYILTIVFTSAQFNSECTCVQARQWSVGIASLFLSWASLILFLRKLEVFGKIHARYIN